MIKIKCLLILSIMMGFAAGCGSRDEPAKSPEMLYTEIAQTAYAQLTLQATGQVFATPTFTFMPPYTNTPPQFTNTPFQTAAPTSVPPGGGPNISACDSIEFVNDITIPDGTEIPPGAAFIKIWRVKNSGTCTWNSQYQLIYYFGEAMGAAATHQLTTETVAPGETLDISIDMVAPAQEGHYFSYWILRNDKGENFGIGLIADPIYVEINVVVSTVTETATPTNTQISVVETATFTPTATATETPTENPTATTLSAP